MLPNTKNIGDLILTVEEFEEDEQEKTQTFNIETDTEYEEAPEGLAAILGIGILGLMRLGCENMYSFANGSIGGRIDDVTALKQSIYLMLSIEADQYIIYPHTYGVNTLDLIGKPSYYVMAVLPDRIKETLLSDDRITDVSDFEFEVDGNKITAKFVVATIYGEMKEEMVVIY